MTVFNDYAKYYDLLYQDKDYDSEINYVEKLIRRFAPETKTILEFGSGTGKHGIGLVEKGFSLDGVELSAQMLEQSERRKMSLGEEEKSRVSFVQGDMRSFSSNKKYDAVISLFHVMSYQVSNDDIRRALQTIQSHTRSGGLLIFDFWYGPAVLTLKPETRVKRLEDSEVKIIRLAEPEMTPSRNAVTVHYTIFTENVHTTKISRIQEEHHMRYLFQPELEVLLQEAGFEPLHFEEWLTGHSPGFDTWGVVAIARLK